MKRRAFEGSEKALKGVEMEYKWRRESRTEYIRTQEEQAAFYKMERLAMEYAKAFFRNISISQLVLDNTDYILPIIFVSLGDVIMEDPENRTSPIGRLAIDPCNHNRFVIRIALPWRTRNTYLSQNLKRTIRHELIHYFLYINDLPYTDDSALFWAYCFLFDAGAYMKLNEEEAAKYQRFLEALENEKEMPTYVLTDLANAIIAEDENAAQRFEFHKKGMTMQIEVK